MTIHLMPLLQACEAGSGKHKTDVRKNWSL